jgi:drug/metabolite transporter (DMT)-like permease
MKTESTALFQPADSMDDRAPSDPSRDDAASDVPAEAAAPVAPVPAPQGAVARSQDSVLWGMAAAIGAFFMLSSMSLLAKLVSQTHAIAEIAFWRNFIGVIPLAVAVIAFRRREILEIKSKPGVVFSRSIIATVSVMCLFAAFSLLPLADATALVFTSALFVPVFGFFFLGERVGLYRWSAIIVGFVGVLIIAQPSGNWNLLGVMFAIAAAVFNAVLSTMLRLLGRTEHPTTLTFYLLAVGCVLLAPVMPFVGTVPAKGDIGLLVLLGLCGLGMQLLLSTAFKYTPAALASLFSYTQIIWATLFGWLVFGDWPATNIIVGAAIIVTASIFVVMRESYLARRGRLARPPGPAPE